MGVNNVPAFLSKIWALVDDPTTDELIAWDPSGMSFHVYDQARFAKEILPLYFKHNNIASFIRQLNMYGFRKVVHLDSGAIKTESDDVEFHHPYFMRGQEHLLENIKRKSNTGTVFGVKTDPGLKLKEEDVTRVLTDVKQMKGKQETLSAKMEKMKKENEALWREVASLRQKHLKQQQIVNKLIQFMVHLVGGNTGMTGTSLPKRKLPLMINNSSQINNSNQVVAAKRPRYSKQLSIEELQEPQYIVASPKSVEIPSSSGPVIQEVIDTLPGQTPDVTMAAHNYSKPTAAPSTSAQSLQVGDLSSQQNNGKTMKMSPNSKQWNKSSQQTAGNKMYPSKNVPDVMNASLDSSDLNNLLQGVDSASLPSLEDSASNSQALDRYIIEHPLADRTNVRSNLLPSSEVELTGQLDHMQEDLDGLKDMLSGGQYNFDPNTLLALFNAETNNAGGAEVNLFGDFGKDGGQTNYNLTATETDPNSITGNELVRFHPSENFLSNIADLSDIIDDDTSLVSIANTDPLASPVSSEPQDIVIDPMSFINTNTVTSNVHEDETSGGLDTPLVLEPAD